MKVQSGRFFHILICCLFLTGTSGCAQSLHSVKDETVAENAAATLQSIKVAPDGSQVEISSDKALAYTFYKTGAPPKVVIDLAQTDPGGYTEPLNIDKGSIKKIQVSRHGYESGFLSRVEILMSADEEPVVTPARDNKKTLLVSFASKAAAEAPAAAAQLQPATEAPAQPVAEAVAQQEAAPVAEPAPPVIAKEEGKAGAEAGGAAPAPPVQTQPVDSAPRQEPAAQQPIIIKSLAALKTTDNGLELTVAGGIETFNTFKLTKPDRLVIDFPDVTKTSLPNTVQIGKFGINNARVGINPGKARVVLDAVGLLPTYEVAKTDTGLKVLFGNVPAAAAVQATAPQMDRAPGVSASPNSVSSIDFTMSDGLSRIAIGIGQQCVPGKPVKTARGWLLTIDNCLIPANLQRAIDTTGFAGTAVKGITPYQVKSKGKQSARILVKAEDAPFTFNQERGLVAWSFKNPPASEPVASAPQPVRMAKAPAAAPQGPGEPQPVIIAAGDGKKYSGRRVTLEFSDADVRKIFQLIAEVSNLNFLISDDVSGTISIKLVNVPWDQALDVILESKNLEMKRSGNIVQIKPIGKFKSVEQGELEAKRARERAMDLQTVIFEVNYSSVGDIVSQLNSLKTPREGVSITADARTNRVIVTEIAPAIEKMRSLLKSIDTPEKQVMIEARIVEASSTFTRDLGIQWGIHYRDGSASMLGINQLDTGFGGIVTPPPSSGTSGPGAAIGMSFGKLTSNVQLDLRLSAAATNGQIKIISTPKVVTLNNKAAKISQGQSIPYQTTSAEGTKTEFIEAALTLEVTPHITADGSIGMKIKASNNSAGTGSPPAINKKEATTELQVKNGETTVIGGIYVDSDTEEDRGVPFLQDIPLLGWLFKSNTKSKVKTELLIFITPRIVG